MFKQPNFHLRFMCLPHGKFVVFLAVIYWLCSCSAFDFSDEGEAVYREKRDVKAQLVLAQRAQADNEIQRASELYETAMSLSPSSPNTYNHYAIFLREQWEIEKAEGAYLQALTLAPGHAVTHYNLGVLYELYLGDAEKALSHYEKFQSIEIDPDPKVAAWIALLRRNTSPNQTVSSD